MSLVSIIEYSFRCFALLDRVRNNLENASLKLDSSGVWLHKVLRSVAFEPRKGTTVSAATALTAKEAAPEPR